MDWVGSWSLAGAVTAAMLALSVGPIVGWSSPLVIGSTAGALAFVALFWWREVTHATPLIPLEYLRRRNFMFPMGARAFTNFAYFGGFFLFPLLAEQVYGYSISKVGFVSVARPLLFAVCSPVAGYLTVRTGERLASMVGAVAVLASMVLFALLTPSSGLVVLVIALTLSANEVAEAEYGVMSSAQLLATQVGEVAGIQVVLTVQESITRHGGLENVHHGAALLHSFQIPFWIAAGVAAAGVACTFFVRAMARPEQARRDRPGIATA